MRKLLLLMFTFGLAITLAACGDSADEENDANKEANEDTAEQANADMEVSDEEKVDEDEVVANVNDTDIKGVDYNLIYAQTKMTMHQFGQDVDDLDAVKEMTLDELIAQELLKQEAEKQGVEVTDEEVQTELDKTKEESEEDFQAYLDEFDITEDTFKDHVYFGLVLDKYMDEHISADEVTDEEAKELYEQTKEQSEDIADYDELEDEIKSSIKDQKKQEKLQAKIEDLKESADIEELI